MKRILTILLFICMVFIFTGCIEKNKNQINIDLSKLRPEIKIYINELYDSEIKSVEHTTLSIEQQKKRIPEKPKPFEAGGFKVVFIKEQSKKAMIFQTEEIVGHISTVIPGETNIGGYI